MRTCFSAAGVPDYFFLGAAGEPDDVAKTSKVKEKKDGAPEKLLGPRFAGPAG